LCYNPRMTGELLKSYERRDITTSFDPRVSGPRTLGPYGTLVHTTSGKDSLRWLTGRSADAGSPASSDALISRTGTQFLITPEGRYAYHAGKSRVTIDREYRDDDTSQRLLGVELECQDTERPTFEQYDSLADLIVFYAHRWAWRWPFIIYGHYAVAIPLGRRSDPVNFDWGTLQGRLFVRSWQTHLPGLN
jgi:N-acetyl-anhydromuramyl-L-alanine amidase AmpD